MERIGGRRRRVSGWYRGKAGLAGSSAPWLADQPEFVRQVRVLGSELRDPGREIARPRDHFAYTTVAIRCTDREQLDTINQMVGPWFKMWLRCG